MSSVCALQEIPETKDLRVVVDRCLELWARVDVTADTHVHVFMQTTHRAAAHAIAELLPSDTRGFTSINDSSENRTAAEILADEQSDRDPAWNGSFGNDIGPDLVRPLLLRLRDLAPDPLRRTSLGVRVRGIRWRGSPPHARGGFVLNDYKVFQRKVRFRLNLIYETRDDLSKGDAPVELKAVADATGVDFSAANCERHGEAEPWTAKQNAVAALLFQEVVERISQSLLRDHFDWSQLPGTFAHGQGMRRRIAALAQAPKEDFRWDADLTELMRTVLPEFRAKKGIFPDAKVYVAPFHEPWSIAVIFDTHPGLRIGRLFKLRCGILAIEEESVRFKQSAPMLRCSGGSYQQNSDTCPEFSFNTRAELTAIFEALKRFLPDFVTRLRSQLNAVLLPGWDDLTSVFPNVRALTAHTALELADGFLEQQGLATAQLVGASLHALPKTLVYRQDPAMELPRDGTSGLLYHWSITYVLGSTSLGLSIPPAGTLALSRVEMEWLELNPQLAPKPIPRPAIDSNDAARRMHEKREELRPRYPEMNAVIGSLELKVVDGRPVWTAQIEFSSREPDMHDWVLVRPAIDATTGDLVRVDFDERFSGAAHTQRTFTER